MVFKTTGSEEPYNLSAGVPAQRTGADRGHGHRDFGTNSNIAPSVLLTFSVTSGPLSPCMLCGCNPALAAIRFACGRVSCAMHLTYFAQAFPTPGRTGSEDDVNARSDQNRPTHLTLPNQLPQGDFTETTHEGRFNRSEIVPTPAKAFDSGSPTEAAPFDAPAMPPSHKQKKRAHTPILTIPLPSGPNNIRPVVRRDPGPSTFGSLAGIRVSASHYPSSKSPSSSSESHDSWTTDVAAEAHAITAKFEKLEIEKQAEALSQKMKGSITADRMDIAQHED